MRIISFFFKNIPSVEISKFLNKISVCIRSGFHCATPLLEYLNKNNGVCRVSLGLYNTYKDADMLLLGIKYICSLNIKA